MLGKYHIIHDAIQNSPVVNKSFVVYRGQDSSVKSKIYMGNYLNEMPMKNTIFSIKGLYSTSILTESTTLFGGNKFLLRMIVPEGSKCLSLIPIRYGSTIEEAEILFDHGTKVKLVEEPTTYHETEITTIQYIGDSDGKVGKIMTKNPLIHDKE